MSVTEADFGRLEAAVANLEGRVGGTEGVVVAIRSSTEEAITQMNASSDDTSRRLGDQHARLGQAVET